MKKFFRGIAVLLLAVLVAGCAANKLPGYQDVYHSYSIPEQFMDRISVKFREHGLSSARVERDNVGRVKLAGSYTNEDEVDRAFIIVQSIVGIKSTSPFYPERVKETRWERDAAEAMRKAVNERRRTTAQANQPAKKRALVIGINDFADYSLNPIQGEDDARSVVRALEKADYVITALVGKNATKAAIESSIRKFEQEIGPDDTVFIYVSSHGNPPVPSPRGEDHRKMSVAAYDSGDPSHKVPRKPGFKTDYLLKLQETSVADTHFQRLAQKPSRITRVVVDTCYSGEMLNDVRDESDAHILRVNGGQPERESVSIAAWTGAAYTAKGITLKDNPTNPGTTSKKPGAPEKIDRSRSGYTFITATSEGQESLGPARSVGEFDSPLDRGRRLRGSFFTQSFLDYLRVTNGEIGPAFDQARLFTEQKVIEVSKGTKRQVPRQFSTLPANQNNLFL